MPLGTDASLAGGHGLPTTADRDKYMALMKIVTDAKARLGDIQNPAAFTTYDLLKHLGYNTGGKNYDEVNVRRKMGRW